MSFANATNVTTIVDLMQYNNSVTDDWFGMFIPIVIWVCAFGIASRYSVEHAVTSASFLTFIASSLLVITGIVNPVAIFVSFGLVVFSYVLSKIG
jgi:hypothetical protein